MTAFIEEAPIYIPGDAWAHHTAAGKQTEAQELDSLVQQYLTQGAASPSCQRALRATSR